jgi:hypothetical protein
MLKIEVVFAKLVRFGMAVAHLTDLPEDLRKIR